MSDLSDLKCFLLTQQICCFWTNRRKPLSYMSGRSRVWTQAAYRSSSSLEIRIFSPSTNISLLSTQFGSAEDRRRSQKTDGWGRWKQRQEWTVKVLNNYVWSMNHGRLVYLPTRYSARHVGRKVSERPLLQPLLFLLLSLRKAALFIQVKAVIGGEALQEPAHAVTLVLRTGCDITQKDHRFLQRDASVQVS